LLARLKKIPELQRIPVIIVSIVADVGKGMSLGAAAVMQKPIARKALYDTLVEIGLFRRAQDQTLKVLVVDDDPMAVDLITLRMQGLVGSVLRAYGGREAIEVARRELPDVIVLDLKMPEVNGFEVAIALKQSYETARIPILAVTANQITAEDRTKLKGFVTTIIDKGEFDRNRFMAEVRQVMPERPLTV
jgi:CheY-like chemotaxis protein